MFDFTRSEICLGADRVVKREVKRVRDRREESESHKGGNILNKRYTL